MWPQSFLIRPIPDVRIHTMKCSRRKTSSVMRRRVEAEKDCKLTIRDINPCFGVCIFALFVVEVDINIPRNTCFIDFNFLLVIFFEQLECVLWMVFVRLIYEGALSTIEECSSYETTGDCSFTTNEVDIFNTFNFTQLTIRYEGGTRC